MFDCDAKLLLQPAAAGNNPAAAQQAAAPAPNPLLAAIAGNHQVAPAEPAVEVEDVDGDDDDDDDEWEDVNNDVAAVVPPAANAGAVVAQNNGKACYCCRDWLNVDKQGLQISSSFLSRDLIVLIDS